MKPPINNLKPVITIEYCPKCGWLLRAAYIAQEILTTFSDEVHSVNLHPSEVAGTYKIFVADEVIFDRKREAKFPEVKELKQTLRDQIAPGKNLGHSDKKPATDE